MPGMVTGCSNGCDDDRQAVFRWDGGMIFFFSLPATPQGPNGTVRLLRWSPSGFSAVVLCLSPPLPPSPNRRLMVHSPTSEWRKKKRASPHKSSSMAVLVTAQSCKKQERCKNVHLLFRGQAPPPHPFFSFSEDFFPPLHLSHILTWLFHQARGSNLQLDCLHLNHYLRHFAVAAPLELILILSRLYFRY